MPLAFDIETEGLNPVLDKITVASIYDPEKNKEKTFFFTRSEEEYQSSVEEFLSELDNAEQLYGFNSVKFDLPFVIARFDVPETRYRAWFLKVFDFFEVCRCVFGSSCSLNKLLEANGHEVKSSNGMQACIWAKEENWKALDEYCMKDTKLTYDISRQKRVVIPLTGQQPVCCVSRFISETQRDIFFHR